MSIITVLMATDIFPWNFLVNIFGKCISVIQFPWRMCSVSAIFVMVVVCINLYFLGKGKIWLSYGIILYVIISANLFLFEMLKEENLSTVYDISGLDLHGSFSNNEYLPAETNFALLSGGFYSSENVSIMDSNESGTDTRTIVKENEGDVGLLEVPRLIYPHYKAFDKNNNELRITKNSNNVIQVLVPSYYAGEIYVKYMVPRYWRVAESISLITLIAVIIMYIKKINFHKIK